MAGSTAGGPELTEWSAARNLITDTDNRLNDLRKYGLGVLASLLTAQGLVQVTSGSGSAYVPPLGKLAIVLASLLLVSTVASIDRIQRSIQRPAAARARVLERQLGMELTEEISDYYEVHGSYTLVDLIYAAIAVGVGTLGYFVVSPSPLVWSWYSIGTVEFAATVGALAFTIWIGLGGPERTVDWSARIVACPHGERIEVLLTNTSGEWVSPMDGDLPNLWRLTGPGDKSINGPGWDSKQAPLFPGESRTWLTEAGHMQSGPYRLYVARMGHPSWSATRRLNKWFKAQTMIPLKREIVVDPDTPGEQPPDPPSNASASKPAGSSD